MRNYIQSARSLNAKPIHSQSPLQKKKLLKFVNQTIKHEKSMQGLSILNHNNVQNSSPVEGFKVEIERRFQESQMNLQYKFPRDISSNPSSNDSSLENLKNMKEYDLHTQNFRERTLDNRIEHLIESTKKKSRHDNFQSSIRVLTSPSRDIEDSKIGTGNNKLSTLVSPKDQDAALYKKVLTLLENNSNKEGSTKLPRTPNYQDQNSLLKQEFKRKLKMQRNDSQENLLKKGKSHFRAKSLLKEASITGYKNSNMNSELTNDLHNLNFEDQRSDIKLMTLGEDESLLGYKNPKKMTVTKSCKDLKLNLSRTIRQPDIYYDGFDLKTFQENKPQSKPNGRPGTQRRQKFLTNENTKSQLTNKTSDSIAFKTERMMKMTLKDLDTKNEEGIKNEISTLATNITEGQNVSREFLSSKEGSKSNLFNKIQENAALKAKITQGFKSPTHASLRTLTTLPLTARNDVENKISSKTPLMSFRSPREKKIVIPLGNQNKLTTDKTSEKPDSERSNHPPRKLKKTSSAKNICQTTKAQKPTQKIPKLFLSKNVESDKKRKQNSRPRE